MLNLKNYLATQNKFEPIESHVLFMSKTITIINM